MSFFKSLLLAILAALFITYTLGIGLLELFDVGVYLGDEVIEPLKAISISALVVVGIVLAAAAIMFTVFGSLIFIGIVIVGAIGLGLIGVFWPIFLAALVIWLVARDKKQVNYS